MAPRIDAYGLAQGTDTQETRRECHMSGWWWVLGFVVAIVMGTQIISDAKKSWQLRSLSPTQRKIVELKLESWKVLRSQVNINHKELVTSQRRLGKIDAEITQLFDTLDEAQKNEVHRAYGRVWRYSLKLLD